MHTSRFRALALVGVMGVLSACASVAEEGRGPDRMGMGMGMGMGHCDPAACSMCAEKMKMGAGMTCDRMKMMPADKKAMMENCMMRQGMGDGTTK